MSPISVGRVHVNIVNRDNDVKIIGTENEILK
jgi:hypothetical protein